MTAVVQDECSNNLFISGSPGRGYIVQRTPWPGDTFPSFATARAGTRTYILVDAPHQVSLWIRSAAGTFSRVRRWQQSQPAGDPSLVVSHGRWFAAWGNAHGFWFAQTLFGGRGTARWRGIGGPSSSWTPLLFRQPHGPLVVTVDDGSREPRVLQWRGDGWRHVTTLSGCSLEPAYADGSLWFSCVRGRRPAAEYRIVVGRLTGGSLADMHVVTRALPNPGVGWQFFTAEGRLRLGVQTRQGSRLYTRLRDGHWSDITGPVPRYHPPHHGAPEENIPFSAASRTRAGGVAWYWIRGGSHLVVSCTPHC